jgi:hypothetical protein
MVRRLDGIPGFGIDRPSRTRPGNHCSTVSSSETCLSPASCSATAATKVCVTLSIPNRSRASARRPSGGLPVLPCACGPPHDTAMTAVATAACANLDSDRSARGPVSMSRSYCYAGSILVALLRCRRPRHVCKVRPSCHAGCERDSRLIHDIEGRLRWALNVAGFGTDASGLRLREA